MTLMTQNPTTLMRVRHQFRNNAVSPSPPFVTEVSKSMELPAAKITESSVWDPAAAAPQPGQNIGKKNIF